MTSQKPKFFTTVFEDEKEFLSFLEKENNSYSKFILKRYVQQKIKQDGYQLHHIKPKHANGTDDFFNLIWLSVEDHAQAHLFLFQCYGNYYDYCAFCMMKNNRANGNKALHKQIHMNLKEQKKGFWDPKLQSELGKRPKSRKPYARHPYVLAALERGFILQSNITNACIVIPPLECSNLREVMYIWLSHPDLADHYKAWLNTEKKRKLFFIYWFNSLLNWSS